MGLPAINEPPTYEKRYITKQRMETKVFPSGLVMVLSVERNPNRSVLSQRKKKKEGEEEEEERNKKIKILPNITKSNNPNCIMVFRNIDNSIHWPLPKTEPNQVYSFFAQVSPQTCYYS